MTESLQEALDRAGSPVELLRNAPARPPCVPGAERLLSGLAVNSFARFPVDRAGRAEPGAEVTVLWGKQPNPAKLQVEPHRQIAVRATVAPAPFVHYARESYRTAPLRGPGT